MIAYDQQKTFKRATARGREEGKALKNQVERGARNQKSDAISGRREAVANPKKILTGEGTKISNTVAFIMVSVAIFFDVSVFLINLIPIAGQIIGSIIGIFAYLIFIFWYLMLGMRLLTRKRVSTIGGGLLISIIPILNMLPDITLSVLLTIASTRVKIPKV